MTKKRLFLLACPIYLFFYMGDALLTGYYALNFLNRGMDEHQQSVLLGLIPFALFLGCIFFSFIARTRKRAIWLFRICALLEAGLVLGYYWCDTYVSLLILTPLLGFFNGAPFALIEGYLVPLTEKYGGHYSNIRIFGSLGYIVSLAGGYFILSQLPLQNSYFFSCAFFFIALILSFFLYDHSEDDLPSRTNEDIKEKEKDRLTKTALVAAGIFIVANFFFYGVLHAATYLLPVRLRTLGFLDQDYSMARAIGVMIESGAMLLMPLLPRITKSKFIPVYIGASLFVAGVSMGIYFNDPWWLVYLFFAITGIGKAFLFSYQSLLLEEIVGKKALSLVFTFTTGAINLAAAIWNLSSSWIYDAIGFQGFFIMITVAGAAGVLLLLLLLLMKRHHKLSPVSE
ncbi:MAG: MFS transporter [Erysipelotrichaceae bacterium]|nr:MFS transporter [Erysipelotrichaceae bacterium]